MAKLNAIELQSFVLDHLPADGAQVSYTELVNELVHEGQPDAVGQLRGMAQRGMLVMSVGMDENGTISHTVKKVV